MRRFFTLVLVLMLPVSVMAFSDTNGSKYEEAVNYLRDNNIVEGYSDGTFKPDESINRAELTKIVLESSGEELVTGEDCFPDVSKDIWYATYVCTAKNLGWVQGYPDGTFKPSQTINRVEALKIIGEAESWELGEGSSSFSDVEDGQWFTPYVVYAEGKNYLPLSGSLVPGDLTTRGLFSEVYFRILVTEERGEQIYISRTPENVEEDPEINITVGDDDGLEIASEGVAQLVGESYSADTFRGMTLDDPFPKTFFEHEMYFFEGRLDDSGYEKAFVFVYPDGDSDNTETFVAKVDGRDFSIPVFFDDDGEYYIGIIPGSGGSSVVAKVTVEKDVPEQGVLEEPSEATNLNAGFSDDQTYFTHKAGGNFNMLVLKQDGKKVQYYQRQGKGKFVVNYADFENFTDGPVSWYIESANLSSDLSERSDWALSLEDSFLPVRHEFTKISNDVDVDSLPVFYSRGGDIEISGSTDVKISKSFAVIKPDGFVDTSDVSGSYNAGSNFSFSYDTASSGGTYIIEVNDLNGLAVVNHPVYESGRLPLMPDYYDLNPVEVNGDSISESQLRSQMMNLINDFRREHGLSSLSRDANLDVLAQDHVEDMADNNYFAHVNLDGDSPNDRRIAGGIDTYVGENITKTSSIKHAHEGFLRSAIHRKNIMRSDWTKVGLGVIKNGNDYLLVAQEFSTSLDYLYDKIIDAIDDERSFNVNIAPDLQAIAEGWTDLMIEEDFFDTTHNGSTVFDGTDVSASYTAARAFIISGSYLDLVTNSIITSTDVDEDEWTDIGLGLRIGENGGVKITLVYAK